MVDIEGRKFDDVSENSRAERIGNDGLRVHPVFEDNIDNGGWSEKLTGFWVAKYQAGIEVSNDNGQTWEDMPQLTKTGENAGNKFISQVYILEKVKAPDSRMFRFTSKKGTYLWNYATAGTIYKNGYYYDRAKESHLLKNTEWGAITLYKIEAQ